MPSTNELIRLLLAKFDATGGALVSVSNQVSLIDVAASLNDIKNYCNSIQENTNTVEEKIQAAIGAIEDSGTVNNANLFSIITELQLLTTNTADQENILTNILTKIISAPATEASLQQLLSGDLWQRGTLAGKGFTTSSNFVSISGTTETPLFLIKNPAGGKLMRLKEFIMSIGGSSSQKSIFRFYRNPTITSDGTAVAINKILSTGIPTSVTTAFAAPTIAPGGNGTFINMFSVDFNSNIREMNLARYITPGANLLVTVQPSATNIEHGITTNWLEE